MSIAALGMGTLLAGAANAAAIPSYNVPGVPPPGYPDFSNGFIATYVNYLLGASLTVVGSGSGTFSTSPTQTYNVTDESYTLTASFNSQGKLVSGTESIWGSISGLTSSVYQNLYTVSLVGYGVSNPVGALGFETAATSTGWASQFQKSNESVCTGRT